MFGLPRNLLTDDEGSNLRVYFPENRTISLHQAAAAASSSTAAAVAAAAAVAVVVAAAVVIVTRA